MEEYNADFHIHSKYSGGCSKDMTIPNIAKGAESKGLDLIATGDATHPRWLAHLEDTLTPAGEGIFSCDNTLTRFIIATEVEDKDRVHHLILFPSFDCVKQFNSGIESNSANIKTDGRPNVSLSGEELVDLTNDCDALIGPCHAFTPWTSVYKAFDSLSDCYGDNIRYVKFLELGLSADTDMADTIPELANLTFMTNSDAHSPWPHRLGREFNRLLCSGLTFKEVRKAIERRDGRRFTLNVGLNPREGKYHETACTRCYKKFRPADAERLKRRCPECRGIIKRGVKERVAMLGSGELVHPDHRPPYTHIIPLAGVIAMARGVQSPFSIRVQRDWQEMVDKFGTEISILLDAPVSDLKDYDQKVGQIIGAFREGRILYDAGGGGRYGRPLFNKPLKEDFYDATQKTLGSFA